MSKVALAAVLGLVGLSIGIVQFRESLKRAADEGTKHSPSSPLSPWGREDGNEGVRIAATSTSRDWQPLFNGVNLDAWQHLGGGRVSVQNGVLVLEHDAERRPGYLVNHVSARDFEARFQCRIEIGDSGFFFRSRRHPRTPTEVTGPQVQLNAEPDGGLGGIFELHGRGWVRKPAAELTTALLASKGWLACHLCVTGDHIVVTIDGHPTVDFVDDSPDNDFRGPGIFALQIHGGGYCRVLFREIVVRILD